MYLRFQGRIPSEGTSSKLGIFQLAFRLRDDVDTPAYAHDCLARHLNWLKANLHAPRVLDEDHAYRAICWFKPEARRPLAHIWPIKFMLEDFGYSIDIVKTARPGQIIYEDGWQVVAKPYRDSLSAENRKRLSLIANLG